MLAHTGLKAGLPNGSARMVNIFQNGGEIARELIETRCHRGADIARKMRFSEAVADGIQNLDEHWDGGGKPLGLRGAAIPVYARIALLAQVIDVFHDRERRRGGAARSRRTGPADWFDPQLAAAFERVAARPAFWDMLRSDNLQQAIFALEPAQRSTPVDEDYLDDIAAAFAQVIDSKSPYTSGHSERVTLFTDMIAEQMELRAERRRWLKRAALLHDIGKLGVSNTILDKPGKLDDDRMGGDAACTPRIPKTILSRIARVQRSCRRSPARITSGSTARAIRAGWRASRSCLETRIITTADIFDALTAERPYRAAMPVSKALAIMSEMVGTQIDADCFAALTRALGRVDETLAA